MSPRLRKLIGLFAILVFLGIYVVVFSTIGDYLPDHWAAKLAFYAVAGTLWGVPLFPLVRWMEQTSGPDDAE